MDRFPDGFFFNGKREAGFFWTATLGPGTACVCWSSPSSLAPRASLHVDDLCHNICTCKTNESHTCATHQKKFRSQTATVACMTGRAVLTNSGSIDT
eukprot:6640757-Alexandrium_andersonii.AAC.1